MTKLNKNFLSVLALGIFFVLALASSGSKKTFNNASKWIPPDFRPANGVLLIEKFHQEKSQKQAEEYMSEKYPYKYEFVSRETIYLGEGKYEDTVMYRFALVSSLKSGTIQTMRSNGTTSNISVSGTDFGFYDRQLSQTLSSAGRESSNALATFRAVINTILKEAK